MAQNLEFPYSVRDEHLEEALKALLTALQWSYAVVWKYMSCTRLIVGVLGHVMNTTVQFDYSNKRVSFQMPMYSMMFNENSDGKYRALVWHQGCFHDRGTDLAHLFESIYKRCYFTNSSPGYAYVAFQKQMPLRWMVQMAQIQTDGQKEQFLLQVGIKTLFCVPGVAPDGTPFCLELATTSMVPGPDNLMNYLHTFVQTEVAPRISSLPSISTQEPSISSLAPGSLTAHLSPFVQSMHPGTSNSPLPAIISDSPFSLTVPPNLDSVPMPSPNYSLGTVETISRPYSQWTTTGYLSAARTTLRQELGGFHALLSEGFPETLEGVYIPLQHPASTNPNLLGDWRMQSLDILNTSVGGHTGEDTLPLVPVANLPGLSEPLPLPIICSADLTQFTELLDFPGSFQTKMKTLDGVENEAQVREPMYQDIDLSNMDTQTLVSEWDCGVHPPPYGENPGEHLQFQHSRASPFQGGGHSRQQPQFARRARRQPLIQRWTELYSRLAEQDRRRGGAGPRSIGSPCGSMRSQPSPVHDEVAHQHKIAEQNRRRIFNGRMETLKSIVPIIRKKDKVSVLTSTIDYIRKLVSHIAELEKDAASGQLKAEVATPRTLQPDEPSEPPVTETSQGETAQAGTSREAGSSSGPVVNVEHSPSGRIVIKVEARNKPQTLLQILSAVKDFGLEVNSLDSDCVNSRLRATVSAERALRHHTLSSCEVQKELQRILEIPDHTGSPATTSSEM